MLLCKLQTLLTAINSFSPGISSLDGNTSTDLQNLCAPLALAEWLGCVTMWHSQAMKMFKVVKEGVLFTVAKSVLFCKTQRSTVIS